MSTIVCGCPVSAASRYLSSSARSSMQLDRGGEDCGTLLRRHVRPRTFVERLACGRACGVDVGFGGQRHLAHQLAGGRRVHLDDLRGGRLDPLAADEELVPFGLESEAHSTVCVMTVTLPTNPEKRTCCSRRPQDQHHIADQELPQHRHLRHPPAPIAGGSGEMRRPARRCWPPIAGRRPQRPRTTTSRSRSSGGWPCLRV